MFVSIITAQVCSCYMSQHEECVFCVGCSCETLISPVVERATAAGWDDKCRANNKPPTYFQDESEFGMKTSSGTHMLSLITSAQHVGLRQR